MTDKIYISTVKLPNDTNTYYIKDAEAVKGTGTSGSLAQWGSTGLTNGPAISSSGTGFLKQDGTWAVPTDTNTWRGISVNGASFKGTGTGTGEINFVPGSNITIGTSGSDLTINAQLPSGGMQFKGSATEAQIKAKTNVAAGEVWLASDTSEEWVCTTAIGSTASASSWEKLGGVYGDMAYANTGTASYTPAGSVSVTLTDGTPVKVFANGVTQAVTTLPSHSADTFVKPTFKQGTFTQGSLPTCTLPVLTTGVSNEVLTIGWSAGSFNSGALPTHAADSFTQGSFTQGTFSAGTTAGLTSLTPKSGVSSATFNGTPDTISVNPVPIS